LDQICLQAVFLSFFSTANKQDCQKDGLITPKAKANLLTQAPTVNDGQIKIRSKRNSITQAKACHLHPSIFYLFLAHSQSCFLVFTLAKYMIWMEKQQQLQNGDKPQ